MYANNDIGEVRLEGGPCSLSSPGLGPAEMEEWKEIRPGPGLR